MKQKVLLIILFFYYSSRISAQSWIPLDGGLNNQARVLYSDIISDRLYVGGNFWMVNSRPDSGIAAWNGIEWDTLFTGLDDPFVFTITEYQNAIYTAGGFYRACGRPVNGFTRWNGICWDSINVAFHNGLPAHFCEYNNLLYCVGNFDSVGAYYSRNIVAWDGNNWIPITIPSQYANNSIGTSIVFQNKLYLAANVYDTVNNTGYCLLTWDGANWGVEGANSGGLISSMAVYNNELYIGGNNFFGFPCDYLVKYDGTNFSCVGNYFHGLPYNLRVIDDKLFAVGYIDTVDVIPVSNMAVWNGNSWSAFSNDVFDNAIADIAVFNNELYVTGAFLMINSTPVNNIAKYDGWYLGEELPAKKSDGIKIYPNPVSDNLTIEISSLTSEKYLSVYNVMGEVILKQNFSSQKYSVDVSGLSKGIYIIEIRNDKNILRRKFVKQ